MRSHLKNDPGEWRKFVLAMVASQTLLLFLLQRRTRMSPGLVLGLGALLLGLGVFSMVRSEKCGGIYRVGMRVGLAVSSVFTSIALMILFWGLVVPLGFLMRLFGQDPLRLKDRTKKASYWTNAAPFDDFERLF